MALDSKRIIKNFSRAAGTYDEYSGVQARVAEEILLYHLPWDNLPQPIERVIDIGCGTGRFLNSLLGMDPEARMVGTDVAHPLVEKARKRLNTTRAELVTADLKALPFAEGVFDIAVSNLTFQWVSDLERAFSEALRVLKKGGHFVFTTLGPGTFTELKESVRKAAAEGGPTGLPELMDFQPIEMVEEKLKHAGFTRVETEEEDFVIRYESLWDLLRTLKRTGASNPSQSGSDSLGRGAALKQAARIYEESYPAPAVVEFPASRGVAATYDVIYVKARKP